MLRFVLALLWAFPAAPAQDEPAAEVRRVIDQFFDGMRRGDSTAVRATLHPEARFITGFVRDSLPQLIIEEPEGFVEAVGTPHDAIWDERITNVEIQIDGVLATAWMDYRFYVGDRFSHCGVNAMQLFHGTSGWQIVHFADTRRRDGCSGE